jgi:hypothetical protein
MVSIHAHSSWQRPREVVIVVLAFALVAFGTVAILMKAPVSHAAASIPANSCSHCYGKNLWNGNVHGAFTEIYVVPLTCNSNCGAINNAVWIYNTNPCGLQQVEAGYVKFGTSAESYYWTDINNGCVYYYHGLGAVPHGSCNDYNHYGSFEIYNESSSNYGIVVNTGCFYGTGTSCCNSNLHANIMQIGEEAQGSNWSAPRAWYTYNEWEGTNNLWHYQSVNGYFNYANPPYVGWESESQEPDDTGNGGLLWTNT